VVTTKSAFFATGSNVEKQLCCTVRHLIINEDLISVIAAKKYHAVEKHSTRKWNPRFHCHEKIHGCLFCFSV